jgi:hypothetical protein
MANQLNSGSLDTLKVDDVILTHVEKTASGGYRAEFVEHINRGGTGSDDVLAMMNASDPRFQRGSKTYTWVPATITDVETLLNIDGLDIENMEFVSITSKSGKVRQVVPLNILNPEFNGKRLRVEITETTTPTDWQKANDTGYKVNPATGETLEKDGQKIYRNTRMTINEPVHTFIQHDRVEVKVEEFESADTLQMM